jgi:hypothetical protein
MMAEFVLEPRHRWPASMVSLAALSTYIAIQKLSGNFGYIAVLNFQLIEDRAHTVMPNLVPNFYGYVVALEHGVVQILGKDFQSALFSVCVSLLAFVVLRERRLSAAQVADRFSHRALILAVGLFVYLVVRFVVFPATWARYMMSGYVLAGILFARAIRPTATTPDIRGPQSGAL